MSVEGSVLQYTAFSSAIDVGFWHKLTKNKLENYKLDESPKQINGTFLNNDPEGLPCRVNVDFNAFDNSTEKIPRSFTSKGSIIVKNTVEDFKICDKKALIKDLGSQILEDVKSGQAMKDPSLLNRFLLLTFADLKKYHFYYWFAFPALSLEHPIKVSSKKSITEVYNEGEICSLKKAYDTLNAKLGHDSFAFLLKKKGEDFSAALLDEWEDFCQAERNITIGFSDPSTLSEHPGWPLRNLLTCIFQNKGSSIDKLTVVCYRDRVRDGRREVEHSLVLTVKHMITMETGDWVGWEKNARGKMGPRMVNLSSTMDPVRLAESAVDLNLKLMRWRLVPNIDLQRIKDTRCLLLGSGTLGCNVARSLLGWGVGHITFVDNSKVSFSNPVRQTLFEFADCVNGGKPKAQAAADSLKRIFPGVEVGAHDLSIPMPGHSVTEKVEASVRKDVGQLESLIEAHDVVFLLMDTRESRWLPSVIAASKNKILINAALGFDTFMVMRHGTRQQKDTPPLSTPADVRVSGDKLGCYFCNDVVAPGNSTLDRTLDQQCTVSRPGISMMASALAVELLVSVLQHPQGASAPAETSSKENHLQAEFETPIGIIPHQIRCFLSRYHMVLPVCHAFDKCTACSPLVIEAYESEGFDFLRKVFNVPKYLEDLTGLTALHANIDESQVEQLSDTDDECTVAE